MRLLRSGVAGIGALVAFGVGLALGVASCGSAGTVTLSAAGAGGAPELTGAGGSGAGITMTPASTVASSTAGAGGQGGAPGSGPPYPFVLAHGFFGFTTFAGLDFETYFFDVKAHLAAQGEDVDTPAVDPFNSSDYRGAQLLVAVKAFLAQTGAAKVNIIGHSQGGLDARVVANLAPELVASVVTISTPHHGTPLGDIVMKLLPDPNEQAIVDALTQLVGAPIYSTVNGQTSIMAAFQLFSQPGITAFNAAHPDSPGVFYASISGRSALHPMGDDCTPDVTVPFIPPWTSTLDPLNPLFAVTELPLAGGLDDIINDGLVRAKDARWGEYWGCLAADHIDEIGQILGEPPGLGNNWKYLDFYTQLIAYMRQRGF